MKRLLPFLLLLTISYLKAETPVEKHGKLHIEGTHILDQNGEIVQFRGMSLFWSQWMDQYYTRSTVKWLARDWQCDIIRIAMGVNKGGYFG